MINFDELMHLPASERFHIARSDVVQRCRQRDMGNWANDIRIRCRQTLVWSRARVQFPRSYFPYTDLEDQQIRAMLLVGVSLRRISKHTRRSPWAIYMRARDKLGLKLNTFESMNVFEEAA